MKYFGNFKNDYKKKSKVRVLIFIFIFLIIFYILLTSNKRKNQKECLSMRESLNPLIYEYLEGNELLPKYNGESVSVNLQDVKKVMQGKKLCEGKVTATKYDDKYSYFYDLSSCGICTTKKLSKPNDKYNEKRNQKITAYYNYRSVTYYNSKWSNWISSEKVGEKDENGLALPLDSKDLPKIMDNSIIINYKVENKNKYSYRDKKWKWYKNSNSNYSGFYSEQPDGYAYKDEETVLNTEYTKWSLDYPEVKSYRSVKSLTGYRWFKKEGKNIVYYNGGEYLVESPGEEYKKDEDYFAKMYSYSDKTWRWYNGTKRDYGIYRSVANGPYIYKDEDLLTYSSWSSWDDNSHLDSSNSSYREERIDVYSRYLIEYKVESLDMLDKYVTKEEFEKKTGKTIQQVSDDEGTDLLVVYKFETEK